MPNLVATPTVAAVVTFIVVKVFESWLSGRRDLPADERKFRSEIMSDREALRVRLDQAEEREASCQSQLRRAGHRIANLEQAVWGLQRKLGMPLADFGLDDDVTPNLRRARERAAGRRAENDGTDDFEI